MLLLPSYRPGLYILELCGTRCSIAAVQLLVQTSDDRIAGSPPESRLRVHVGATFGGRTALFSHQCRSHDLEISPPCVVPSKCISVFSDRPCTTNVPCIDEENFGFLLFRGIAACVQTPAALTPDEVQQVANRTEPGCVGTVGGELDKAELPSKT